MGLCGSLAGPVAHRFGSKSALIAGTALTAAAFALLAVATVHPVDMLISSTLLGAGIGFAYAALGNLIVQAVPASQTGVATGMNTVMRTLGGALGGQLSATFIVNHQSGGLPSVTGFTETFVMATGFLVVCILAGLLIPGRRPAPAPLKLDAQLATTRD
jgi:MFS family permease